MSDLPSYYAWQPSFESGREVVSIFLTRGWCQRAPDGGREFFEAILTAAGIDAPLGAWGVKPFLTSYFAENAWEECWDAKLLLAHKLQTRLAGDISGVGIRVLPTAERDPAERLPLRVLADFESRRAALKCRDALRQRAEKARWDETHYERYLVRDLGPHRKQLLVDVTTVDRSRGQEFAAVAKEAMIICDGLGGQTHAKRTG